MSDAKARTERGTGVESQKRDEAACQGDGKGYKEYRRPGAEDLNLLKAQEATRKW